MKKKLAGITLAGAVALASFGVGNSLIQTEAKVEHKSAKKPQNVIMMVMDGTSSNATTLARWYKGKPLHMDQLVAGGVRAYSAESAITDSAPAATALATGNKSNSGYVGVLPSVVNTPGVKSVEKEDQFRPVANVLEGAKLSGRATGIVATSEIQHATPAGFSAHNYNRDDFQTLAEQQVYQNIDVVLGGGKQSLLPGKEEKSRKDGENLVNVLNKRGYDFVENKKELEQSRAKKIWGSFADRDLAYDMDRPQTKAEQPKLSQMTNKAITTLSKDKDGFFLFVEGSKTDWAAHANDPVGMISDVLAFDEAVGKAVEFAKKDGNTMVIAIADHGNSGLSIGNANTTKGYDTTPVSAYIDPLKKAKMTLEGATSKLKEDLSNKEEVAALYGLSNLTSEEKAQLTKARDKKEISATLSKLLANRANLGFTTGGHTGEDVFLYSYGVNRPTGHFDNTDIAKHMAKSMNINLNELTNELFIEANKAFKGSNVAVDSKDKNNPVLIVTNNKRTVRFPVNKNIAIVNGKEIQMDSVVVQDKKNRFFVPKQAQQIVTNEK
ncbi:alkaline phosphatase [Priestia aryabhattai]|uniref:alkaline phosphatase n=1 Tax=Priestia aryabhattai TaxID=412384 RepID=UPI001ADB5934|nr:alkaline phosphatase [Priestia aryabhattai]QTL50676.1 alkaline phosphatase [Priestia aryabhattai]